MTTLKKYNIQGDHIGDVLVASALVEAVSSPQSIKDYIVALRENLRQWSASTKTRSEVSHSTKKPHPQKGTGRARQGSLVSPQYKGGGIPFGPKPKFDQHVKINRKEKRQAIKALLAEKFNHGKVTILDQAVAEEPKTKIVSDFLSKVGLNRSVIFLDSVNLFESTLGHDFFKLGLRNIPFASYSSATTINGYDLVKAHHLVITESALAQITEWLAPGSHNEETAAEDKPKVKKTVSAAEKKPRAGKAVAEESKSEAKTSIKKPKAESKASAKSEAKPAKKSSKS